jgi:hypothetical protein
METLKSVYKIGRWFVLAILVIAGLLMLKRPAPPAPPLAAEVRAEKAKEFEQSLAQLETKNESGSAPAEAHFDTDQVNSFIAVASAEAAKQSGAAAQSTASEGGDYGPVSSSQVAFSGDVVTAQAVAQRYGRDVYVTVSGHIGAKDGYVTFEPTEFKVGSLSVPIALVNPSLQKMLHQPDVRERMKLPEFISELRVENSELVIVKK